MNLIKSVARQVLAGRPRHVAGQPLSLASLLPPPGERAHEANPQKATKWGRSAREFGQPATGSIG
jgi:hypothetical protein